MRNEKQLLLAGAGSGMREAADPARELPPHQLMRGVAGRLRSYGDVRAGFEPWRRAGLLAWALRQGTGTVH